MINAPTLEQLNKLPRLNETDCISPEEKIVYLHFRYQGPSKMS